MNALKQEWDAYVAREQAYFAPYIQNLHITLDEEQPHIQGERYLIQAVTTTSGKKLILLGTHKDMRVVLKVSTDKEGMQEIIHERTCRTVLEKIRFAYDTFFAPPYIHFIQTPRHVIAIQQFIPQEIPFLKRPIEEQFTLALSAFKAQESARATTYGHEKTIRKAFETADSSYYLKNFETFIQNIQTHAPNTERDQLLKQAKDFLTTHEETIERYRGFLTHTDFVPHNIRIKEKTIFLLDHSSLRFGNKYEGWARFLNFMTLYNPELEQAFLLYIRENRIPEEYLCLRLMRTYRLTELIWFYARTLDHLEGDMHTLNTARVEFWTQVLQSILEDTRLPDTVLNTYIGTRDALRTDDEKKRQQGLH